MADHAAVYMLPYNRVSVRQGPDGAPLFDVDVPSYSGSIAGVPCYGVAGSRGLSHWWQVLREIDTRYPVRVRVQSVWLS